MSLTFESRTVNKVAVIRCKGRITFGPDVMALEAEVDRLLKIEGSHVYRVTDLVLNLSETQFLDSAGLGALVRFYGMLRSAGGALHLCAASAAVLKVIELTNLRSLFPVYETEEEAIASFSRPEPATPQAGGSKIKIVCVDPSKDVSAALSAFLTRSGYDVSTTRLINDAAVLVSAVRPRLLLCGPGMANLPAAATTIERLRQSDPSLQILQLPADFHTTDAGEAGQDLLARLNAIFGRNSD